MVVVENEPVQCSYHSPFGVGNTLVAPYVVRIQGDDWNTWRAAQPASH